ncbi:MAG: hypothetical protein HYV09_30665 [Deltaproteobacteria bacterium]|nr:hypothetical protein [Deltaproteobacteria bacterium]
MITSSIPGRLRVRHPSLRAASAARTARAAVAALPGVLGAAENAAVGSLLVTYDPARIDEPRILAALGLAASERAETGGTGSASPAGIPACMTASLLVSLGAAAVKVKWLHVTAGIAFVGCVAAHVIERGQPRPHHHRHHGRRGTSPSS